MEYELYHHGILGQKWGKRNGPPYPLGPSDHSKSEQKAGWKKSLSNSSKVDNNSRSSYNSNTSKEKHHLTDNQKKALKIGAAVVGTALVTAGAVYAVKSGKAEKLLNLGKPKVTEVIEKFGSMPIDIDDDLVSPSDLLFNKRENWAGGPPSELALLLDLKNVNANGGTHNCVACVITEYLRSHHGLDVVAKDRGSQFLINEIEAAIPDYEHKRITGASSKVELAKIIRQELMAHGDGATGLIGGTYSKEVQAILRSRGITDTGHAFKWTICGDKLVFTDGQNRLIGDDILSKMLQRCDLDGFSYGRLDGLEIDKQMITIFCENRS